MTSPSVPERRPTQRIVVLVLGSIAALLVAGLSVWMSASGVRQAIAYVSMTNALAAAEDAGAAYAPVAESLAEAGAVAASDIELAQHLAQAADNRHVEGELRAELVVAVDELSALAEEVARYEPSHEIVEPPSYLTAHLDAVAAQARERLAWYREHLDAAAELEAELEAQDGALHSAAAEVFASAARLAPAVDSTNWVATVDHRLEFRRSVGALTEASLDAGGVDALERYVEAAAELEESHQAELASFAGPLYDNRLAAQQFANSISGGVFLDFDWVPELFGFGGTNGMAGQASLESEGEFFFSRITLTDSVAERWGDGRAESLVAHEVGHAITLKCIDIFTAHAGGDYEAFATAWAIGMGYDTPSNGQAAYGRPSDDLIAATLECR